MDPRKVGASDNDTGFADDFGNEERVHTGEQSGLMKIVITDDQLASTVEMFPPESAHPPSARRSTMLDFDELPILHGSGQTTAAPVAVAVARSSKRQRLSPQRAVRLVGIVTIAIAVIVGGRALMNQVDMPHLVDDLVVNRTSTPAVLDVRPPAEAVHDAAGAGPASPKIPAPPNVNTPLRATPPIPSTTTAVTSQPPSRVQQKPQSTRTSTGNAVARAPRRDTAPRSPRPVAAVPRPARPVAAPRANVAVTPSRAERAESLPPPVERTRPSPSTTSSQQATEASSPRALPAGSAAPAVPAATSAPVVPAAISVPAVPGPTSAQPTVASGVPSVPVVSVAPSAAIASAAPSAPAASAAPSTVNRPPAVSAPPTPGVTTDTRAVALTLNRYQQAFSSLDANAAHAVWPSVDVKALVKAFDQLEEQTFELEGCNISVTGARADADCAGNARYIRKVGNRALRVEPRHWHFRLRQAGDQWVIDGVDAR